ncbi:hypothetical protein GUJ93_ZPchr0199g2827 [Zizania palustris]|uniref:Acidic protein n=1 Tax=Zizania palustris TaxID=103762 RepID=A0A8J5SUB7_ZIZPA|nr:hypothetical protein GUJ93_ZPchr0408g29165 [Zizania palustris]KAG8081641.1 hypothetical protein GUJ93_ZPchr0199g2827 [Zizania palustris]
MVGKGVGKSLIVCVLVLGFVLGQIQLAEAKSCCPTTTARNIYNACRLTGASRPTCASLSGCKIIDGTKCPSDYPKFQLGLIPNFEKSDLVDFCKLGCISSMCSKINTVVGSEEGDVVVDRCSTACYRLCSKEAVTATVVA